MLESPNHQLYDAIKITCERMVRQSKQGASNRSKGSHPQLPHSHALEIDIHLVFARFPSASLSHFLLTSGRTGGLPKSASVNPPALPGILIKESAVQDHRILNGVFEIHYLEQRNTASSEPPISVGAAKSLLQGYGCGGNIIHLQPVNRPLPAIGI